MDKTLHLALKYAGIYVRDEYFCELTRELDSLAGIKRERLWKHYILADNGFIKDRRLPIRIPGGTVGGISIDDDYVITDLIVDTNYVVKTYPKDINEILKKYIGYKLVFVEDKVDNSLYCEFELQNMVTKRDNGEITQEEFEEWYNENCKDCIHMGEVCMFGEK